MGGSLVSDLADGQEDVAAASSGVTPAHTRASWHASSNRELVLVEITYPAGCVAPVHRHPVAGLFYIVEGIAESAYGDEVPRRYGAGETLQDRADVPHTLFRNCDPERPLRFLAFYALGPGRSYVTGVSGRSDAKRRLTVGYAGLRSIRLLPR